MSDASKQIARCLFGGPLITHAIIVSKESQSDVNRDMAYNLRDSLREYLILLLTIERNEVSE